MGRNKTRVVPAVLEREPRFFLHRVRQLGRFTRRIHIDIIDGQFVRSETVPATTLRRLPRTLWYQYHFMVRQPARWVERVRPTRGNEVIFQVESRQLKTAIANARRRGLSVALAINPKTRLTRIRPWLLGIDKVVCLGVQPGAQGQPLAPATLRRLQSLRRWGLPIAVDGGIRAENVRSICRAGAAELIVGSAIVRAANPAAAWRALSRQATPCDILN